MDANNKTSSGNLSQTLIIVVGAIVTLALLGLLVMMFMTSSG